MWSERRELTLSDGTLTYRDSGGPGPVVVFVHGLLVDADLWAEVADHLGGGVRCIGLDLPLGSHVVPFPAAAGGGLAGVARTVADALAALDLDDVALVGHDTGGAVCQLVVDAAPERLGRLVLTSCDAYEHVPPALLRPFVAGAGVPGAVRSSLWALRTAVGRRGLAALVARRWDDHVSGLLRRWLEPSRDPSIRQDLTAFLRAVDGAQVLDAASRFGGFERPVLVAWGEGDRLFPRSDGERLARDFPSARFELVPRSRTFTPLDRPDALAGLIAAFVREDVGGRR